MAKRRRKSGGEANSCCPVIRVKCPRVGRKLNGLGDLPAFLRPAEQILADRRASADAAARAGRRASVLKKRVMCTVKVGGKARRVNVYKVRPLVAKIVAAQKRKRCIPLIKKG